ncbi:glycosyltransferase [Sunxiuqinia indica]|uniref:glycosyltransferase n=1 Tax=Sunxiuqinia indica TaxID=2692584 RepID=UPI00135A7748|nr:glycosyltransferase [Sunxiuqinia indica]
MKNICFFNSTLFWGGGEKSHLEYAINFHRHNYQVCIVASSGSVLESKARASGIRVYTYKISNLSFLNPFKINALAKFFRSKNIDTLFLNSSPDLKLGGLAAQKAGVKNIVYMRGLAVPVKSNALNRYLLTKVITHPVPNSLDTRKAFLTHLKPHLNESNVPVIYRGINFEEWDSRPVSTSDFSESGKIILGNVGRLVEQKGQKHLVELANILRERKLNFKLYIVGSGPLENNLQKLIQENGLENLIELIGFQSDVKSFLNSIDLFVFPSLWEGFGNAMVEAMAEKKVPVAFKLTSNPEIIENGENGFLIDYADMNAFADKVEFLATQPEKRKEMGKKARESVIQKFSFEKIMDEWKKLLG